jgi:hypothetical protein
MNEPHPLLSIATVRPSDPNVSQYEEPETEERRLQIEELVSETNLDDSNDTSILKSNGSSHAFHISAGQLFSLPPLQDVTREYFQAIQKWEGQVTSIGEDSFRAQIRPIVGEGTADQVAEIYINDVAESDRLLIEPGAIFYWSIGYLDRPSGRLRASILRFRRLPTWTKQEIERAEVKARELRELLDAE